MNTEERLALVADIELTPGEAEGRVVSMHVMRSVLVQLARRDGVGVTIQTLAGASNLCEKSTRIAIVAIEHAGLVRVTPGRPNRYHVQWDHLRALPRKAVPA